MKFNFERTELRKTGKFILGLAIAFAALNLLASLAPLESIELITAQASLLVLGFFGFTGKIVSFTEPVIMQVAEKQIMISYLCTGLLETILIISAIMVSFGINLKKRIFGALAALIASFIANIARISLSIGIIFWGGLELAELAHSALFRITLFITLIGIYYAWFGWATKKGA